MSHQKTDFNDSHFDKSERETFGRLLSRLRTFEENCAREFCSMERRFKQLEGFANNVDKRLLAIELEKEVEADEEKKHIGQKVEKMPEMAEEEDEMRSVTMASSRNGKEMFRSCLNGKINGKSASILVDTGANKISICDQKATLAYGLTPTGPARTRGVKGIDNKNLLKFEREKINSLQKQLRKFEENCAQDLGYRFNQVGSLLECIEIEFATIQLEIDEEESEKNDGENEAEDNSNSLKNNMEKECGKRLQPESCLCFNAKPNTFAAESEQEVPVSTDFDSINTNTIEVNCRKLDDVLFSRNAKPPEYPSSRPKNRYKKKCFYCRNPGHLIADCRKRNEHQAEIGKSSNNSENGQQRKKCDHSSSNEPSSSHRNSSSSSCFVSFALSSLLCASPSMANTFCMLILLSRCTSQQQSIPIVPTHWPSEAKLQICMATNYIDNSSLDLSVRDWLLQAGEFDSSNDITALCATNINVHGMEVASDHVTASHANMTPYWTASSIFALGMDRSLLCAVTSSATLNAR